MAKEGEELIKFVTRKVVSYIDTPSDLRKKSKTVQEPWKMRWFGMIPTALFMWFTGLRSASRTARGLLKDLQSGLKELKKDKRKSFRR